MARLRASGSQLRSPREYAPRGCSPESWRRVPDFRTLICSAQQLALQSWQARIARCTALYLSSSSVGAHRPSGYVPKSRIILCHASADLRWLAAQFECSSLTGKREQLRVSRLGWTEHRRRDHDAWPRCSRCPRVPRAHDGAQEPGNIGCALCRWCGVVPLCSSWERGICEASRRPLALGGALWRSLRLALGGTPCC